MAYLPVKRIPSTLEVAMSTCSAVVKGEILSQTAAGHAWSTSAATTLTSAANSRPAFIAAEPKDPSGSSLGSTNILVWPIYPDTVWEALTSSAATLAMTDVRWDVENLKVKNETTTDDGMFIVETLTDRHGEASSATNLRCLGRIVTDKNCYGSVT